MGKRSVPLLARVVSGMARKVAGASAPCRGSEVCPCLHALSVVWHERRQAFSFRISIGSTKRVHSIALRTNAFLMSFLFFGNWLYRFTFAGTVLCASMSWNDYKYS